MENFSKYFKSMLESIGYSKKDELTVSEVRHILSKTNEYFYTSQNGLGKTFILDEDYDYFSEFHQFWERHHKEILNPKIDEEKCLAIAEVLNDLNKLNGARLFNELYDTATLRPDEICQIRYFSANQDFRGSRDFTKLFEKYSDDPTIFDKQNIYNNPEDFLRNIEITSLSQNDKRIKYARKSAEMLIELGIDSYALFEYFDKDILQIREFLLENRGSGFGNKKTDMFLRDMVVLNVWEEPVNFDKINVASDINTIKVALRTGILKTEIPLVSSFLDIFCYQYGLIDEMNALAWRRVWEIWKTKYPNTCIESPCLIDYFVYRIIGKEFCKESLYTYKCENQNHLFKWHSGRNKTCQVCKNGKAEVIDRVLPCTDIEGYKTITESKYVKGRNAVLPNINVCPFVSVCQPGTENFRKLNPPKSISILGQTGWESARTNAEEGGGGLMA